MTANFKRISKDIYSFDIDVPYYLSSIVTGPSNSLMGYIYFKEDGSVEIKPLTFQKNVTLEQSISTFLYVLRLFKKSLIK